MKTLIHKLYSKKNFHKDGSFDRFERSIFSDGTSFTEVVFYEIKPDIDNEPVFF